MIREPAQKGKEGRKKEGGLELGELGRRKRERWASEGSGREKENNERTTREGWNLVRAPNTDTRPQGTEFTKPRG